MNPGLRSVRRFPVRIPGRPFLLILGLSAWAAGTRGDDPEAMFGLMVAAKSDGAGNV